MADDTSYTSIWSGAQIDTAVAKMMSNDYSTRTIFSHAVATWTATTGTDVSKGKYYIDITLSGVYSTGQYPIIYFVDGSGEKYEVDWRTTITSGGTSTSRIFSNTNTLTGTIIEIASLSSNAAVSSSATWDQSVTYGIGALVIHSNTLYISRAAGNINHEPSSESNYWSAVHIG